ncbi:MAG: hypothetical protein BWY76_00234 [bacterium ADurb.Bin429]|nr:MAG: hypothetical protein BWY76_00234 [bacterium ADurb.Bin429]
MTQEHIEDTTQSIESQATTLSGSLLPRLKALLMTWPDVRLAYYQPAPADDQLCLLGPDRARVILCFARSVSGEHISKRLAKIRRHFKPLTQGDVEFLDIEDMDYREACEVAFNAQVAYGALESAERDRLYRYNVFLEWNASKRVQGTRQDAPPVLAPSLERPPVVVPVQKFLTPLYRQMKLLDGYLRELRRIAEMTPNDFTADAANKGHAESCLLKGIQSVILVTLSIVHRNMRLAARDYRDLFLLLPLYGLIPRERANKLAKCAELRDRLMFQYDDVTSLEVHGHVESVLDTLTDFKTYMLEWLFDRYYDPTGELVQTE